MVTMMSSKTLISQTKEPPLKVWKYIIVKMKETIDANPQKTDNIPDDSVRSMPSDRCLLRSAIF